MKLGSIDWIALVLTIVGGLNWGLVGAFNYNLVDGIFCVASMIAKIVYILVGLSAIWLIYTSTKISK